MDDMRAARYRRVVWKLFVLLRAAESQPPRAGITDVPLEELYKELGPCLDQEQHLVLLERSGWLFVNGVRTRLDCEDWAAVEAIIERLHRGRLSGIVLERDITREDLLCVAGVLSGEVLARAGLKHAQLLDHEPNHTVSELHGTQLSSVFLARRLLSCVGADCALSLAAQKRILSVVAAELLADPAAFAAFGELEQNAEQLTAVVATCLRAVSLAQELGLPEPLLRELALATLLAPLGLDALVATLGTSQPLLRAMLWSDGGEAEDREGLLGTIVREAQRGGTAAAVLATLGT